MTVIQLWHHIIQIIWVIQLIQWLSAGSPGAVCPDDVEEAPVRPSWRQIVGSIFKVFVVGYYQKPCVGSILKAGLPSSLPKWGRWGPVRPSWRPSPRLSSASQFYTSLRLVDRICFFSDEKYFVMSSSSLSWSLMTKVKIFKVHFAFKLNMVYLWLKSPKKSDIEIRSRN